jgi:uncharacterized protein (DUF1330 family)
MMPAYIIARVNITDRGQYQHYLKAAPPVILQYGGRIIARSGAPVTLEGPEETRRIIIIEFPSVEKAKEWYHSPEYRNVKRLREGAGTGELIVVDEFVPG